jgi:hypothetical protein
MPPNNDLLETILMAGKYALSNLASLLVGGIVVALSFLVIGLPFFLGYAVVYIIIVAIPGIPVLVFSYINMTFLLLVSTILLVITMAVAAAIMAFVFFASWVLYASTGSVRKAVNIKKVIGFIMYNPEGFLVAIAASAAIAAVGVIAMALFVTIPWALFTMSVAVTFIYARFYQDTAKLQPSMVEWLR